MGCDSAELNRPDAERLRLTVRSSVPMGRGALGRENPAMNCRATFNHSYGMAEKHHFAKVETPA
jgi:hypothetical protein